MQKADDSLSLAELVRRSVSDNNNAMAPARQPVLLKGRTVFQDTMVKLRERGPLPAGEAFVPTYAHPVCAGGRGFSDGMGAWLPQDFSMKSLAALDQEFFQHTAPTPEMKAIKKEQLAEIGDGMRCITLVDASYSTEANNEAHAILGQTVLHMYARTACHMQLSSKIGAQHQSAALELIHPSVLAQVFRATNSSSFLLTSIPIAKCLPAKSYYARVIGTDVIKHYPDDGEAVAAEEAPALAERAYSTALCAVVGSAYLEHGLDGAIHLIEHSIIPGALRFLDGKARGVR